MDAVQRAHRWIEETGTAIYGPDRSIAESLVLSDKTVKRHLSNILEKLGVRTRAAAVGHSLRRGLL
jgi:DNA-binding CsgD family transcriptional regulator